MKAILLLLAATSVAHAQALDYAALDDGANIATVTAGGEHGVVVGVGFAHVMTPLVLVADLTTSRVQLDADDLRVRAGAYMPIVGNAHWKLIGGAAGIVRTTNDDIARMVDVGVDVSVLGGYYAPRWFAAAEVGFDWAIATHITHSDDYRMIVYADARDGWYHNAGGILRAGLQGGVSFGANDITLRAGMLRDDAGDPPLLPFYATLGYARHW